jgi:hypothetical protein
MNTAIRTTLISVAALAAAAIVTASVLSQEGSTAAGNATQDKPAKGEKDKARDKDAPAAPLAPLTSEQMQALIAPGEPHKKLAMFEGTWNQDVTIHTPGAEPTKLTTTATYKPILDGRFVMGHYTGSDYKGSPFEAYDIVGYDAFRNEYFSIWLTNHSTSATNYSGEFNKAGEVLTMTGKYDDTMTGAQNQPAKTRIRSVDDNTLEYEYHTKGPDGKFVLAVEVKATRAER